MTNLKTKVDYLIKAVSAATEAERRFYLDKLASIPTETKNRSPESIIKELFFELGLPDHNLGYKYCMKAVMLALEDFDRYVGSITAELYPAVASAFGTTPARTERAIRHAIENAWTYGDSSVRVRYFGTVLNVNKGKPTNAQFIARIAHIVQDRLDEN